MLSGLLKAQCPFTATITPSSISLCPFRSDTLFTETADSYQWFRNGAPVNNNNLPYLVVSNPADNNASILVVQTIDGCSESSSPVTVTGISLPTMTINIDGATSGTACLGDTVNLSINSGQTENITWFRNGNPIAGQTGTSINVLQAGNYSATGAIAACPANTQFSTGVILAFTNAPVPQIFEDEAAGTLSTDVTAVTYQWFENGTAIESGTTQTIIPTGAGIYSVLAQYSAGCSRISEPYDFIGFPVICDHDPVVTGELLICPNGEITLSTAQADAYQWLVNGDAVAGGNESSLVVSSVQAGNAISVAVTLNGCTEVSPEVTPLIYFFAPVSLVANGNPEAVCAGDSIELILDGEGASIIWLKDGIEQSGLQGSSVFVDQAGNYSATVTNSFCPDLSQTTNEIPVTIISNPTPEISIQGSSIVCSTEASSYIWTLNGSVVAGLNSSTILGQPGIWTVTAIYSNGCEATSTALDGTTIGFEEVADGIMLLGPNPCIDQVHLNARAGILSVYSSEGKLVFKEEVPTGVLSVNTKNWMPGLYFFSWEGKAERGSFLLLKQ